MENVGSFFIVIFHTVKRMAVTCHFAESRNLCRAKAGLGSEEKAGEAAHRRQSDTIRN